MLDNRSMDVRDAFDHINMRKNINPNCPSNDSLHRDWMERVAASNTKLFVADISSTFSSVIILMRGGKGVSSNSNFVGCL